MQEAARIGRPLGVVCAVASGAYAMATLYDPAAPTVGPLTTLGALVVAGCTVATLLTAAVEARQARADTTAALLRLGAPATMLRSAAALRAGALLALFGPLTLIVAELAALPLTAEPPYGRPVRKRSPRRDEFRTTHPVYPTETAPAPRTGRDQMTAPAYQQMIFVNLPVNDLDASKKFFTELGYSINPQFSDDNAASVVISDTIVAMLLTKPFYSTFTKKEIADATKTSEVLICSERREPREGRRAGRQGARRGRHRPRRDPGPWASCTAAPSTTSTATPGRSCGWTRRPSRADHGPQLRRAEHGRVQTSPPMRPHHDDREIETLEEFDAVVRPAAPSPDSGSSPSI